MYTRLLKNMMKYDADISHCGYQMIFPDGHAYFIIIQAGLRSKTGKQVSKDLSGWLFIY